MLYSVDLMINHSVAPAGAEHILEQLGEKIVGLGGKLIKKQLGDLIVLDTAINKSNSARYASLLVEMPADKLVEMEYQMKVTEGIVRKMVRKLETEAAYTPATFPIINDKDYKRRPLQFWLDAIHMNNPSLLKLFLTPRGKIFARKLVYNIIGSTKPAFMKQLSNAVKRARFMGWLRLK